VRAKDIRLYKKLLVKRYTRVTRNLVLDLFPDDVEAASVQEEGSGKGNDRPSRWNRVKARIADKVVRDAPPSSPKAFERWLVKQDVLQKDCKTQARNNALKRFRRAVKLVCILIRACHTMYGVYAEKERKRLELESSWRESRLLALS